jgi:hypothetical protein
MNQQLIDDLTAVRELLSDPARWTRRAYAKDANGGTFLQANDPEAVCWCLAGACHKVTGAASLIQALDNPRTSRLKDAVRDEIAVSDVGCDPMALSSIAAFNDDSDVTHADVLAVLDRAIEKARAA